VREKDGREKNGFINSAVTVMRYSVFAMNPKHPERYQRHPKKESHKRNIHNCKRYLQIEGYSLYIDLFKKKLVC
jgi:hypothetical protein